MDRPRALYVHVPFCSRICPYCAFNVTARFDHAVTERFLRSIEVEIGSLDHAPLLIETVYVGGGTPSVLNPPHLARLLGAIGGRCRREAVVEWTVEMNPETVDPARVTVLREAGVTRVSLGVQSMQPRFLRRLGRTHTVEDVERSVAILKHGGFERINVDLIYAQPGQTRDDWRADVEAALALDVTHFSLYELTFEPSTPFGRGFERGSIPAADDSLAVALFEDAQDVLSRNRIEWYEVSNFAFPGHESEHNRSYWRNDPYFGVGPGAFGCTDWVRTMNASDVDGWCSLVESSGSGIVERMALGPREIFVETLAVGLRTREGVDLGILKRRTGIDVMKTHGAYVEDLCTKGLARCEPERLRLTLPGVLVLDSLMLPFLDFPERNP